MLHDLVHDKDEHFTYLDDCLFLFDDDDLDYIYVNMFVINTPLDNTASHWRLNVCVCVLALNSSD